MIFDLIQQNLQGDEPAIRRNDQRLASLKELSSNVVPLKLRRTHPTKQTTAVALCDWNDEEVGHGTLCTDRHCCCLEVFKKIFI